MDVEVKTRIRAKFRKYGVAKYISHVDLIRVFERAMRRAGIPLAYSKGFHPHPKMSFSPALAVGITSDAEYIDVDLTHEVTLDEFNVKLDAALPDGFGVTISRYLSESEKSITGIIAAGVYTVEILAQEVISLASVTNAVEKLLAQKELMVVRETKKRTREVDIRPLVYQITAHEILSNDIRIRLDMLVAVGSRGNVRPEEIVLILGKPEFLGVQLEVEKIHRQELFILVDGKLIPPV